jgi:hypothetical protein
LLAGCTRAADGYGLIWLPHGHGLQLDDRPPDAKPDKLPVAIGAFEHLIGSPGCHYLRVGTMFADQQIGGTPDVAIGDHSASSRSAAFLFCVADSCFAFALVGFLLLARIISGIDVVDAARRDELNLDDRRLVACPNIMSVLCRVRKEGTNLAQLALLFEFFAHAKTTLPLITVTVSGSCPARFTSLWWSGLERLGADRVIAKPSRGGKTMRVMIKFALPVESSNTAIRTGKLEKVMHQIVEDLKPEAAYFFPTGGERGGFFIVEMQDSSQIADMAERFFFGLNAKVELVPVMSAADLEKGLSTVQNTIQRYG